MKEGILLIKALKVQRVFSISRPSKSYLNMPLVCCIWGTPPLEDLCLFAPLLDNICWFLKCIVTPWKMIKSFVGLSAFLWPQCCHQRDVGIVVNEMLMVTDCQSIHVLACSMWFRSYRIMPENWGVFWVVESVPYRLSGIIGLKHPVTSPNGHKMTSDRLHENLDVGRALVNAYW